jgi:hypothetical protein
VDGLHVHMGNRRMNLLQLLPGMANGGRVNGGSDLTNEQRKAIHNCHNESPCTMNIC